MCGGLQQRQPRAGGGLLDFGGHYRLPRSVAAPCQGICHDRTAVVSPADIAAFQRDGAVCLRQVLSTEQIELLKAGIDWNLAHPSPRAKVASQPDDPGWFIEDFCNWQENRLYRQFLASVPLGAIGALLTGSAEIRLYHDHMLTKEPGTRQRTPWHQDQPYYNIEGQQNVSCWIPVDPVSRSATLEFLAGSHRGPWLMPRTFRDAQARWFPEGSLADLPDIEGHRERFPIIGWELEPGDMVCFQMLTLHAAGGADQAAAAGLLGAIARR